MPDSRFWEDDLPALQADLGEIAVWNDGDRDHQVRVTFEDPFVASEVHDSEAAGTIPIARATHSEMYSVAPGHTLRIVRDNQETTYQVLEVQPTGRGQVRLRLSEDTGN